MKRINLFLVSLGAAIIILAQCVKMQDNESDMANLLKTIEGFDKAWDDYDMGKALEFYSEHAIYLQQNREMMKGMAAIKKFYNSPSPKPEKWNLNRNKVEIKLEGNLAYEVVDQIITAKAEGSDLSSIPNKYIHIWEKQKDGTWKLKIDMNNSNQPPPEN